MAAVSAFALAALALPASVDAQQTAIIDRSVAFSVVNKNDSGASCEPGQPDGATYTVRGSIVGPAVALARPNPAAMYIHGAMVAGDNLWRMRPGGDESFDYGLAMARRGHASVSVEMVGYGSSVLADRPDGNRVCQGSLADVILQLVQRLRSGDYTFGNAGKGPAFARVGVAGLSAGAQYAQAATYSPLAGSPSSRIDALIVMGHHDTPVATPEGYLLLSDTAQCASGGGPKNDDGSGPPHYWLFSRDLAPRVMFYDPDPRAESEWRRLHERDPCGLISARDEQFNADAQHLDEITVPVLLAYGDHDELFGQPGPQLHEQRFTGSADRKLMLFPGAGHVFFLEKQRDRWIEMIAGWLAGHGL